VTHVVEPAQAGQFTEALEEVRRSAQQLLADVGNQPRLLRIRAGEVVVELEWTEQAELAAASALTPALAPALTPAPAAHASDHQQDDGLIDVCAPTVGTFYRAPEPGAAPFVAEGDQVSPGQQIGIVEAMKLMIPIEADRGGLVRTIHVKDAAPVEYGERLVTISPVAG
jgi:acetyl-CoA carboxylase biotin carboxyl carrier protein